MIASLLFTTFIAVACAYVGLGAFKRLNAMNKDLKQDVKRLEEHLNAKQQALDTLLKADLKFQRQIHELDKQLLSLSTQIQGLATKRENDGGYHHALRILEMGGTREEIIQSCHLTNAQADLFMNLHAYRQAIGVKES